MVKEERKMDKSRDMQQARARWDSKLILLGPMIS